jgi:uncharacterized protein YgiM (DUF1202 family)
LAKDRDPLTHGAVVRVYQEKNRWYKISGSKQHWVSARFTVDATHASVNANVLNVRSGPGTNFSTVGAFMKGEEVFIVEQVTGWCKVAMEERWVSDRYLTHTT